MHRVYGTLLQALEAARRDRRYSLMKRLQTALFIETEREPVQFRSLVRSKIFYEFGMAAYDKAMAKTTSKSYGLMRSRELHEKSAVEAEKAGDQLGVLFANMNISGLVLVEQKRYNHALALSEETSNEAEKIAKARLTPQEEKRRAWRIAGNCYAHRIRILTRRKGNKPQVALLRKKIMSNRVIRRQTDYKDFLPDLERAQIYLWS